MHERVYNSTSLEAKPSSIHDMWSGTSPRNGFLLFLLPVIVFSSGCCALHREKAAARMIEARELTYSGIRAEQDGQLGQAESIYARAVEMSPEDENARTRYAESLARRGAFDEAIQQMSKAHQISHNDPTIAIRVGELCLQKGDRHAAMQAADQALRVDRKLVDAWRLKGRIHEKANEPEQALSNYLRALTCGSDDPEIQMEVAECYLKLGRHQRALSNLNLAATSYANGNEPETLLLMKSDAYNGLNRTADSIRVLASLVKRPDSSVEAWHRYGNALVSSGDTMNARLVLQNAAIQFPNEQRIADTLARLNSLSLPVSMNR